MGFETQDVERKILTILKILRDLHKPAGARIIARELKDHGIELSERAVRYHLKLTDERGLTELVGRVDGRTITDKGLSEISSARVKDKVGFAISRIEMLAFRTNFDYVNGQGEVPVNVSFFPKDKFKKALGIMSPAFESGFCVSDLVITAENGQKIGDVTVPDGKIGFATICSIVVNGTLLKAGIPMDSRFGGILQLQNRKPVRFTEIIHYNGSSLDPSEIFIKARMTSVRAAASTGNGEVLANFREVPAVCRPIVEDVLSGLKRARLGGILSMGNVSESVCQVPVDLNRIGLVLLGGLNPVAAAQEAGLEADNYSMSTVVNYKNLIRFGDVKCA